MYCIQLNGFYLLNKYAGKGQIPRVPLSLWNYNSFIRISVFHLMYSFYRKPIPFNGLGSFICILQIYFSFICKMQIFSLDPSYQRITRFTRLNIIIKKGSCVLMIFSLYLHDTDIFQIFILHWVTDWLYLKIPLGFASESIKPNPMFLGLSPGLHFLFTTESKREIFL